MRYLFIFSMLMLFSLHTQAATSGSELLSTMNKRLSYMQEVALFKAQNHLPIEDIKRERKVIISANKTAEIRGLSTAELEHFFAAQISVAKAIQYRYRADWLSAPINKQAKNLNSDIRPELILLGNKTIKLMVEYLQAHGSFKRISFDEFSNAISAHHVNATDKQLIYQALLQIKLLHPKH